MPIHYVIDSEGPFVHAICTGEINDADVIGYSKQLAWELPESVPQLFDLSEVKRYRVTAAGMKRVATFDAAFATIAGAVPVAIVAESDFTYGMSRMYQARSESNPNSIEIFRCACEAKQWLLAKIAQRVESAEKNRQLGEPGRSQPVPRSPRITRSRVKAALTNERCVRTCGKVPRASTQGPASSA
jgi:hypothetical protein